VRGWMKRKRVKEVDFGSISSAEKHGRPSGAGRQAAATVCHTHMTDRPLGANSLVVDVSLLLLALFSYMYV
jgi:hypothetical protein